MADVSNLGEYWFRKFCEENKGSPGFEALDEALVSGRPPEGYRFFVIPQASDGEFSLHLGAFFRVIDSSVFETFMVFEFLGDESFLLHTPGEDTERFFHNA